MNTDGIEDVDPHRFEGFFEGDDSECGFEVAGLDLSESVLELGLDTRRLIIVARRE